MNKRNVYYQHAKATGIIEILCSIGYYQVSPKNRKYAWLVRHITRNKHKLSLTPKLTKFLLSLNVIPKRGTAAVHAPRKVKLNRYGAFKASDGTYINIKLCKRPEVIAALADTRYTAVRMARLIQRLYTSRHNSRKRAMGILNAIREADLPLTKDGDIIAYRYIKSDWTDAYTGKLDNSPGVTVKMPRCSVDERAWESASSGLHFSAYHWADSGSRNCNSRLCTLVQVQPEHVVVQIDSNNQKFRCCEFVTLCAIDQESATRNFTDTIKAQVNKKSTRKVGTKKWDKLFKKSPPVSIKVVKVPR